MIVEPFGTIPYALPNSIPENSAPTSAAISAPSPVSTFVPSARERNAHPPVASTTAPALIRYSSPVWRCTPAAPDTRPASSTSSSSAGE